MGNIDSNGVYIYEDTDAVSPLHTLLNMGQQSISNILNARPGNRKSDKRLWVGNRSTTDNAAAGFNASVASITIPGGEVDPGLYIAIARHKLGQNQATGTLEASLTTPSGTATNRRSTAGASFADIDQADAFLINTGGQPFTVSMNVRTSAGDLTVFAGSTIIVARVIDF